MDVLVTGADQRQGLAAIRALGSRRLRVFAAGLESHSLGFFSRYTAGFCQYPSPYTDKEGFIATILQVVKTYQIPVVIPVVESTVITLDEFRGEFEGITQLALPSSESLLLALDKKETLDLAQNLCIPIPKSCFADSMEEALSFADDIGYPIVMKPRAQASFSKVRGNFPFKVTYARNRQDCIEQLHPYSREGIYPILQQYCPGVKVNQGLFYAGNELLGLYQYKGVREYPLSGGVTSLHLSVPIESELREWTLRLIKAMAWEGVAMVEYKVNEVTGQKVLMEVNGRFWAPLSAANKLGLNFPYALYRYVKDGVKERLPEDYPLGIRNRYLRGDLVALMKHWLGHSQNYLAPMPGKGRALWDFLRDFRPGVQGDVWDWRDRYPGLRELGSLPTSGIRQMRARKHRLPEQPEGVS
jgi:predicted ATP-grasp superfamily ATP-dependent carboligase